MEVIRADFDVVTPLFLGAESRGDGGLACADTIRGSSIKGALRFWFRALQWPRIQSKHREQKDALAELHKQESALFGAAAVNQGKKVIGGQGQFLLRVKNHQVMRNADIAGRSGELEYLLGMGLFHFRDKMLRDHIAAGSQFSLELALKPSITAEQRRALKGTLLAFGFLGNLGSRARKGFGSVTLTHLEDNGEPESLPATQQGYADVLSGLIARDQSTKDAPLTAFGRDTRLQISATDGDSLKLLKKHGQEMALYRGWGRSDRNGEHKTLNQPSEQNFGDDHDWALNLIKGEGDSALSFLPRRTVFGLPHPYHFSSIGRGVAVDAAGDGGRRASPLFAHIHRLPGGQCLLVHCVFRNQFLPPDISVKANPNRGDPVTVSSVNDKIHWQVLDDFLDRFKDKELVHE